MQKKTTKQPQQETNKQTSKHQRILAFHPTIITAMNDSKTFPVYKESKKRFQISSQKNGKNENCKKKKKLDLCYFIVWEDSLWSLLVLMAYKL